MWLGLLKEASLVGGSIFLVGVVLNQFKVKGITDMKYWPYAGLFIMGFSAHLIFEVLGFNKKYCETAFGSEPDEWIEEIDWDAESQSLNLVLMGVPGSGKGSQAKMISKKYGIPQIGMGDIIRENLREGTELGLECKGYMDRGDLVPDNIVIEMVRDRLQDEDCKDGYVLDGFPRTLPQGKALKGMADIDHVLFLDCIDDVVIARLGGRRNCSGCGNIYHLLFKPPANDGVCDDCGGELFQRDDDNEPTVRNRLKVFNRKTAPLIEFYDNQGLLRRIDANPSLDDVFENVETEVYGAETFASDTITFESFRGRWNVGQTREIEGVQLTKVSNASGSGNRRMGAGFTMEYQGHVGEIVANDEAGYRGSTPHFYVMEGGTLGTGLRTRRGRYNGLSAKDQRECLIRWKHKVGGGTLVIRRPFKKADAIRTSRGFQRYSGVYKPLTGFVSKAYTFRRKSDGRRVMGKMPRQNEAWLGIRYDAETLDAESFEAESLNAESNGDLQLHESKKRTKMSMIRTGLAITTFGIVMWNLQMNQKQERDISNIMSDI